MKIVNIVSEQMQEPKILDMKQLSKLLRGFVSDAGQPPLTESNFKVFGPVTSMTKSALKLNLNSLDKNTNYKTRVYFFYKNEGNGVVGYKVVPVDLLQESREPIAQGLEHRIFSSKKNPDILFKIGEDDIIDEWVNTFKNDPEVFPIIYRVGYMPDKKYKFVSLEKLDTKKFEEKWDELELALEDIGAVDVDRRESFTDLYSNEGTDSKVFYEIATNLRSHTKEIFDFYMDLLRVIKRAEKVQNETLKKDTLVDAHKYNFGYDKNGKFKMLDI